MEYLVAGLLLLVCLLLIVGGLWLSSKLAALRENLGGQFLQADLQNLSRGLTSLERSLAGQVAHNQQAIQDSLTKQLSQSSHLIQEVTTHLTKLDETNQRVVDVASELKTLQAVLQNPKQRGVFGEFYLESILANVLPPGQWQRQYQFADSQVVDAVIFLDGGKILPVDSKFSLENYNRLLQAETKTLREACLSEVKNDLKKRIDETSKYIRPQEQTMDFAFMFIPSEALYYDLLINQVGTGRSARDLIEYAFRDKKVIIVSPTSFMAYLQTVLQGLRSLEIERQAQLIQKRVSELGTHLAKFDEYLLKLGQTLGTSVNHYNRAYQEFGKVDRDVIKIAGSDPAIKPLKLDRPLT